MKKFRYRMESILKIKLKLEDQAKLAYANALAALAREEDKLNKMKQKKISYEEEQRNNFASRLDIKKMKQLSEAIDVMKQKIENQTAVVKTAEKRLEAARARLNEAMIERKTQEKLKERAWQEYMAEYEAEEQKEIDEHNSFIYSGLRLHGEDSY